MISDWIIKIFEPVIMMTSALLIERYVLLEPLMNTKKQVVYYAFCYCIVLLITLAFNSFFLGGALMLLVGLDISFGRKEHRIRGFFLTIPLIGISIAISSGLPNVILAATNIIAYEILSKSIVAAMYLALFAIMIIFMFVGKKWRSRFSEKIRSRKPTIGELATIIISGMTIDVMVVITFDKLLEYGETSPDSAEAFSRTLLIVFYGMAFALSLIVIIMITQGYKRKFYHDKVKDMQFSVISTMADIVENRDENTGGHIKRTARYVEIISRKLHKMNAFPQILTEEYIEDMIVAAPLHDIGKIHIPDAILNKPGRLTDEEFEIMKTHTTAGRDILLNAQKQLGDFNYINTAIEMAEYHHEWWNGKGYPNAVSGEDIPLCARIMAVADVFDALTAKRCYKDAMPADKAFSIISEESGTHFDPAVTKAFLSSADQIEAVMALALTE